MSFGRPCWVCRICHLVDLVGSVGYVIWSAVGVYVPHAGAVTLVFLLMGFCNQLFV